MAVLDVDCEGGRRAVAALGGRLGDPDADMAPVLVFLASDAAHFMTGQTVVVDGGMIMLG